MTFPEFLTYCELKELVVVKLKPGNGIGRVITTAIQGPYDDIALHLKYCIIDNNPVIECGQFYKFSDRELDYRKNYAITMDDIEEVFFQ